MPFDWLLRAVRWVRHPPSAKTVKLVLAVIAAALALGAYENYFGWPEVLTVDNIRRGPFR